MTQISGLHGTMVVVHEVETKSLHCRNSHNESLQKSHKITFKQILESILTWKTINAQKEIIFERKTCQKWLSGAIGTHRAMVLNGIFYEARSRCWIWFGECSKVEPRYNEGPRDCWQNTFAMTRFRFIIIEGLSIYVLLLLARRIVPLYPRIQ